jgi:hypothetical protein
MRPWGPIRCDGTPTPNRPRPGPPVGLDGDIGPARSDGPADMVGDARRTWFFPGAPFFFGSFLPSPAPFLLRPYRRKAIRPWCPHAPEGCGFGSEGCGFGTAVTVSEQGDQPTSPSWDSDEPCDRTGRTIAATPCQNSRKTGMPPGPYTPPTGAWPIPGTIDVLETCGRRGSAVLGRLMRGWAVLDEVQVYPSPRRREIVTRGPLAARGPREGNSGETGGAREANLPGPDFSGGLLLTFVGRPDRSPPREASTGGPARPSPCSRRSSGR